MDAAPVFFLSCRGDRLRPEHPGPADGDGHWDIRYQDDAGRRVDAPGPRGFYDSPHNCFSLSVDGFAA
jgi:hypothetical protein